MPNPPIPKLPAFDRNGRPIDGITTTENLYGSLDASEDSSTTTSSKKAYKGKSVDSK